MKEQSHKREMGSALRGDFERLRARRGGHTALIEPAADAPSVSERDADSSALRPALGAEPEAVPVAEASNGGSWLDRLRGRV